MPIARVGTPTTYAMTASGLSATLSLVGGVAIGDFLIFEEVHESTTATSSVSGSTFQLLDRGTDSTTVHKSVFYRFVDGTEPASFTVNFTASQKGVGIMSAYSGVDQTNPFSDHSLKAETVTGTGHTTNSITPGSVDDWIVSSFVDRSTSSASKNTNWTPTAPAVERAEVNNSAAASSPWWNLEHNDENAAVGSTAAKTHTSTSTISQNNAMMWIAALNPAAAGGGSTTPRLLGSTGVGT